jgi:hypothetical protein
MTLLTAAPLRAVYKVFSCLESVIIQGMISGDLLSVILKRTSMMPMYIIEVL